MHTPRLRPEPVRLIVPGVHPAGRFHATCVDRVGAIRWEDDFANGVTTLGFNYMLDAPFRNYSGGATLYPYFYIGLIGNSPTPSLSVADTLASHTGWAEDYTHYTPATYTGTVNNSGGYSSSATTMTITGVSQAITNGTPFTVTQVTGTGTYTVLSSVGGATPTSVTFTPGLTGAVNNSVTITFNNGRGLWTPGAAASKSITNSSTVNFPINTDNTTIDGVFVTSDPTLNGTSGTPLLWSTALFSANQTLYNGDTLKITYTVSLS